MTKREKILLWSLIGVLILSSAGLVYAYRDSIPFLHKDKDVALDEAPVASGSTVTTGGIATGNATTGSVVASTGSVATGTTVVSDIKWVTPAKVADPKIIKLSYDSSYSTYYKVANYTDGGEMILGLVPPDGPGASSIIRFKKTADGKYYYLKNSSTNPTDAQESTFLVDYGTKTFVDTKTAAYADLASPDKIVVDSKTTLKLVGGIGTSQLFSDLIEPKLLMTTASGSIYRIITGDNTQPYLNRSLYLKHADGTISGYIEDVAFLTDSGVANVTLTTGAKDSAAYNTNSTAGCGGPVLMTILTSTSDIASRVAVYGTASTGDKVYTLMSQSDVIATTAYNNYSSGRGADAMTFAQYFSKPALFLWKDGFGDYVLFMNNEVGPMGECGKPVIYLYPTEATKISVKVGAEITKSEPAYNDGWNVLAQPNGQLTLDGVAYPNLFWEGIGNGAYPAIDSGFVVKSSDTEATLSKHLTLLGLNTQEKADFMEYWLPKMPKTAYTRLTWLGTRDMDRLAPLTVVPTPETKIRIFLDFQGLDKMIDLKPQRLSAPKRVGYTLVEWGGLLAK